MRRRIAIVVAGAVVVSCGATLLAEQLISFTDDFEGGTGKWEFLDMRTMKAQPPAGRIVDSGDGNHGRVLSLPAGNMIALVKGSEGWGNYKVEGEVCFPRNKSSLMGLVYNLNLVPRPNHKDPEKNLRTEFGSIYIKCGGSYIRVNPHYDGTAGRALYEDLRTPLTGEAAIELREWQRFKYEVVGGACHVYVADMDTPKVTFNDYHYSSGRVGFRPRSGGSEFWVDSVTVKSINDLTYRGPILPLSADYSPDKLRTTWDAIEPFKNRKTELEDEAFAPEKTCVENGQEYAWAPFPVDDRGCVLSGKICDFGSPRRKLAYFHTTMTAPTEESVTIQFSSRSKLTIFVNGEPAGQVDPVTHIWPDFWKKRRHKPTEIQARLKKGENHLVVLVDGGNYPGDAFYAYCSLGVDVGKQKGAEE